MSDQDFNSDLIKSIEKGLASFGVGVTSFITRYLQNKEKILPQDFSLKPDDLDKGLESFFGKVASKMVEEVIVGEIRQNFGISSQARTVVEVIKEAREKTLAKSPQVVEGGS